MIPRRLLTARAAHVLAHALVGCTLVACTLSACTERHGLGYGERDAALPIDAPLAIDGGDGGAGDATIPDAGPLLCEPDAVFCAQGMRFRCDADGRMMRELPCPPDLACVGAGRCERPCAEIADGSDRTCQMTWVLPLHTDVGSNLEVAGDPSSTAGSDRYPGALLVANTADYPVDFVREAMGSLEVVPASSTESIEDPWDERIAQATIRGSAPIAAPRSGFFVASEAMRAMTYSPLAYWLWSPFREHDLRFPACREASCLAPSREGTLLSPERAEGGHYTVVTRPAEAYYDACADEVVVESVPFVTIVPLGSVDRTVSAALTAPIRDAITTEWVSTPVPGAEAGETLTRSMRYRDVWQLTGEGPRTVEECAPEPGTECRRPCTARFDLTGTRIDSTGSLIVIAGHECARVPEGSGSCGHLLEQMPEDGWYGTSYAVRGLASFEGAGATLRVVALADADVTIGASAPIHLATGAIHDVALADAMHVTSTAPIALVRVVHGGEEGVPETGSRPDPAMAVVAPIARFASEHLVPRTAGAIALVVAPIGAAITLDGAEVTASPQVFGDHAWREIAIPAGTTAAVIASSMPASVEIADVGPTTIVLTSAAIP